MAKARKFAFGGRKKCSADNEESEFDSPHGLIESVTDNDALSESGVELTAGTAWHYCREDTAELDYLFIDEAGQISLADALALATAARNVILLGDPQQLPQVSQATHPAGSSLSVLEHLLGKAQTIEPERGVFLDRTWRMHPDVCRLHLGADVRRAAARGAGPRAAASRRGGRAERHRVALARRSSTRAVRSPRPRRPSGSRRRSSRCSPAPPSPTRRRPAPPDRRGHPRPRPLQRPGPLPQGAPAGRRSRRHRRQVPGAGGTDRLLLDGDLERRPRCRATSSSSSAATASTSRSQGRVAWPSSSAAPACSTSARPRSSRCDS